VLDIERAEPIAVLSDGPTAPVTGVRFSPTPGDQRILATTERTGFARPVIWDPLSGARVDVDAPLLTGDLIALDWSDDGEYVLAVHVDAGGDGVAPGGLRLRGRQLPRLGHLRSPVSRGVLGGAGGGRAPTLAPHLRPKRARPAAHESGDSDTRTTPAQASEYVRRLREAGGDVLLTWFDGGHETTSTTSLVHGQELVMELARRAMRGERWDEYEPR
jgi:hypothetical protein